MALTFPNPSRSFDSSRNAVRFSGYDGMFEVQFFVDSSALQTANAAMLASGASEASSLSAFDGLRAAIHAAALKAYTKARGPFFTLTAKDFD